MRNTILSHEAGAARRRAAGLSLIEVLVALAVTAILLTATAVAFDAALTSYRVNHDMAMAGMSARNSLYQMCGTIRSAWNDPAQDTIDVSADGTECALVDADGRPVRYRYTAGTRRLQVNINNGAQWYTLIENVDPLAPADPIFSAVNANPGQFPAGTVARVEIRFKTSQGQVCRSVSAAVVPRNVLYND